MHHVSITLLSVSWCGLSQEELRLEAERVKAKVESLKKEKEELVLREVTNRAEAKAARGKIEAEDALEASRYQSYTTQ